MRRTYGSKKAATGGLDHREMLLTVDEKSSAFDAFYIQNIKQTKRELSCMGSSNHQGVASSKVRKRKYVKRIIKEVEYPVRKSVSDSVYLTPDRSIRVNKVPDLFDQLLNSSPVCAEPKEANQDDLFDKLLLEGTIKTYNKKKAPSKKKYNYSSSDTIESDEENWTENKHNQTQNVTDIQAHKLLIEKEHHPSPKIDESINKIVQNFSLLNNLKRQKGSARAVQKSNLNSQRGSTRSVEKSFRFNKNRLTQNINMATIQSSPLSSTPLTDKFRSQSIYKFSPIPMGNLDDSLNFVSIIEDKNESLVLVPKTNFNKLQKSQSENRILAMTHLKSVCKENKSDAIKHVFNEEEIPKCSQDSPISSISEVKQQVESLTSSLQRSEAEPFLGFANDLNELHEDFLFYDDKEPNSHKKTDTSNENKVTEKNESKDVFEDSSVELKELSKPFYGCSNDVTNKEEKEGSFVFCVTKKSNSSHLKENSACVKIKIKNYVSQNDSEINYNYENTLSTQPFLGFNKEAENKTNSVSDDILNLSSQDNHSQDCQERELTKFEFKSKTNTVSDEESSLSSEDNNSQERESLYDTCNSAQSSLHEEDEIVTKEPIVALEKMNLSLLQKYYEKMPDYDSFNQVIEKSSNDYASMETNSSPDISESSTDSPKAEIDITYNEVMGSNFDETGSGESIMQGNKPKDEEEYISFVTTRRGQKINNNSAIFDLDDSNTSFSSSCNYIDHVEGTKLQKENVDETRQVDKNVSEESIHTEPRISFVTTRKSTKLFRESNLPKTREVIDADKQMIVLQPGKKWERSLSIYRRATTTDHFDHSLLEDEDLNSKGRKYRQSVINTMELQDTIGSISNNESCNRRRSTFISKPTRSTIRIVKEPSTRLTLSNTTVFDDLKGFLEDCDDTVVELSNLSIADSERDITVLEKIHDSRVTTARDYVLRRCNQTETLLFDECYPDSLLKNCQKIGEGVYGEVYLYRGVDGRPRVMKIVPIAGSIKVNGEQQKDFDEVISEIVIAMELSALRAPIAEINRHFDEGKDVDSLNLQAVENATDVFNEVLAVKCVYGNYPSLLLDRWDLYDEIKGSENDNPAILPADQQYIVLELANAGQDLESYQFNNAEQAHALFYQVAYGLAVAEEAYQFEHRDLHWGNVLIAPTDQKYATFVLRGRAHRVPRCGVAASIIDYSLSRISLPLAGGGDSAALYNDLAADDGLFGAVGDYQFSVYRLMREKLGNDWKNYEPYTNILWLHYVVDKMITALRYKRTNTKTHKQYINKLKEIKERILNYGSATLFVLT